MKNVIKIEVRQFPVTIKSHATGGSKNDTIVISKEQLQAAQIVGQSSKELISRLYEREGFTVLDIGKAEKKTISLNLGALWEA